MPGESVNTIDGATFLVSDRRGDAGARRSGRATDGLFFRDTRHLSTYELSVEGGTVERLSTDDERHPEASFFLAVNTGPPRRTDRQPEVSLWRRRTLDGSLREEISLTNHASREVPLRLTLRLDADFADLFEVAGPPPERPGTLSRTGGEDSVHFLYAAGDFRRATHVRLSASDGAPMRVRCPQDPLEPATASASLTLAPRSSWSLAVEVEPYEGDGPPEPGPRRTVRETGERLRGDLERWRASVPRLVGGGEHLSRGWRRSVDDLAALRFTTDEGEEVLAAGLPWFMALFGRDALISGYQTLAVRPELSKGILRALARRQSDRHDDFTEREPGKILHELRLGELTRDGRRPHRPYYGTADATPLFLVLLHETWRWTADDDLVRELEPAARGALAWISTHTDPDGYVDYARRSPEGLENQNWKDSPNSALFSDGSPARAPIAPCEVQGYVFDAWLRSAELAERVWGDHPLARRLRGEAAALRERFDRDFWMPDQAYYALALDDAGRRVDSTTSNPGHLLWSGIVPREKAPAVVQRLMDPASLFSGWGVRTMSPEDAGYNPIEYHNGTVWPHDNALICAGLHRYGYHAEATRLASAILEAASFFDYRLPEVFAGYDRANTRYPVRYPTSSSPQAWAAGTIPLLTRLALAIEPDPLTRTLASSPPPPDLPGLRLLGVPAFGERFDLPAPADA